MVAFALYPSMLRRLQALPDAFPRSLRFRIPEEEPEFLRSESKVAQRARAVRMGRSYAF